MGNAMVRFVGYFDERETASFRVVLFWGDKDDTIIDAIYFLKKKFC